MLEQAVEVAWPVRDVFEVGQVSASASNADGAPGATGPAGVVHAARAVTARLDAGAAGDPWPAADDARRGATADAPSDPVARQVTEWDTAIMALLARTERSAQEELVASVPPVLSASAAMDLAADPEGFAERLVRPLPRRRNRHAELGTAFHAWVEARLGIQPLITDEDLPGAADESIGSPEELAELKAAFERLEYASRVPAGLEVPFALAIGGRLIRGRIDAVFPAGPDAPDGQLWEVVDWKTSARDEADPLQLAIYRLAWADLAGVPVESVGAAFAFIRTGTIVRPADLPDAQTVARLLSEVGDDSERSGSEAGGGASGREGGSSGRGTPGGEDPVSPAPATGSGSPPAARSGR
jgi:DNA helicase-2/ATP-dependent DNA helicase PcrA